MRKILVGMLIGTAVMGGICYAAAETLYSLKAVTSYEDATACGKAGGKGAFVFNLDAEGNIVGEQAPYCILEAH